MLTVGIPTGSVQFGNPDCTLDVFAAGRYGCRLGRQNGPSRICGQPLTDGMEALFVEGATFIQKPYTMQELGNLIRRMLPI